MTKVNLTIVAITICLCLVLSATIARTSWAFPINQKSQQNLLQEAATDYDSGGYSQAIVLFKQLLKTNLSRDLQTSIFTNLGSVEAELSQYEAVLNSYRLALSLDPHHIGALLGVGLVSRHLGDNITATKYLKEVLNQPVTTNDSNIVTTEKVEKGLALVYLRNYSQALDAADQILKQNPTSVGGLEVKEMALLYMGRAQDALTVLNSLIAEGYNLPWVLDDRGVSLMGLHDYIGAVDNFNSSIKTEPSDSYAYFNRAESVLNQDFYIQKIHTLQQFKEQKQIILPHIYVALQDLNLGLQIDPHNIHAIKFKSLLLGGLKMGWLKQ